MPSMSRYRRLIPLLAVVLVIQGLAGVVPHTHRAGEFGTETSQAEGSVIISQDTEDASHDCLACSIHAPVFETAGDRGLVHGVVQASPAPAVQWSISVLSLHQIANPRAPPRIV